MEILLILIVFISIISFEKLTRKSVVGAFFFMAAPYVFIIIANNLLGTKFGFFKISIESTVLFSFGFIFFYFGCWFARPKLKKRVALHPLNAHSTFDELSYIKIKPIFYLTIAILFIRIVDLGLKYSQLGLPAMASDDMNSFTMRGPWAHAFLASYALMAILFMYWLKHKEQKKYIYIIVLFVIVAFSSFVKYHAIVAILLLYMIAVLYNKKSLIKGTIIIAVLVTVFFVLNYFLSFLWRGVEANNSFFIEHLWHYISTGIINTNHIVGSGSSVLRFDVFNVLISMVSSFPRMIINGITGTELIPAVKSTIPYLTSSSNGKAGNVVNTFAYVYTSGSIGVFILFCVLWGFISELFFRMAKYSKNATFIVIGCIYTTFNILSFFAPYAVLSAPWEMLFWSLLIVPLFKKKTKSNWKNNLYLNKKESEIELL